MDMRVGKMLGMLLQEESMSAQKTLNPAYCGPAACWSGSRCQSVWHEVAPGSGLQELSGREQVTQHEAAAHTRNTQAGGFTSVFPTAGFIVLGCWRAGLHCKLFSSLSAKCIS